MAILWHDGFDASASGTGVNMLTYLGRMGYTGTTNNTTATGRLGTGLGMQMNGTIIKPLPSNLATLVVGMGYTDNDVGTESIFQFYDDTTQQCLLRHLSDGTIQFVRGSTVLGTTAAGVFQYNTWQYFEIKVTIDNAAGAVVVKKNGVQIISATGLDTTQTSNAYCTAVHLGASGCVIDDVYILDTTGSSPWNDFLGPVQSLACMPTSEGTTIEWTPSTGTDNSAMVDEKPPNDDTDYNSVATTAQLDLLNHADVPAGTVICVTQRALVKKTDAGVASLKFVALVSATEYADAGQAIGDSYSYLSRKYETNPDTAAQWSVAGVNGAEFGYESN